MELTQASQDVMAERQRQTEKEGWTPKHDDTHTDGALAVLAARYALEAVPGAPFVEQDPTGCGDWCHPKLEKRRNLVVAGALILAEIERLDRAAGL